MQWCVYVFLVFPANPQGGFQAVEWGNQWRQLTDASKNEYAGKALAARNKKIDIKAIIKNIHSMVSNQYYYTCVLYFA